MAEDKKVIIELDIDIDEALADTIELKESVIKLTKEAKKLKKIEGETSEAYVKKQANTFYEITLWIQSAFKN